MEDLFDKDITVINKYIDRETRKPKYKASYIKGFWSSNDGISINGTQITKSDGLIARILMSQKGYLKPKEFQEDENRLTVAQVNKMSVKELNNCKVSELSDKLDGWTLKNDDYLVKGIVDHFTNINDVLDNYQEVMKITNIATKDHGSKDMWHFAITGA